MNIVLTICTRERREMLRACLASVIAEPVPDGVAFAVVVVENAETRGCAAMVEEIGAGAPFALHYVHEPRLGEPVARNRAVAAALDLGAEWIGFIDNDVLLIPGWFAAMTGAIGMFDADVVAGEMRPQPSVPWPDWLPVPVNAPYRTGERLHMADTGNALVRAALFRSDGLGLRFDESLRFSGGVDIDFFQRARRRGARIVWAGAPATERLPACRLRLGWHLYRVYSMMAVRSRIDMKLNGRLAAARRHLGLGLLQIVRGTAHLLAAGLVLAVTRRRGRAMGFRGLFMISKGVGRLAGLAGVTGQPYRQVES